MGPQGHTATRVMQTRLAHWTVERAPGFVGRCWDASRNASPRLIRRSHRQRPPVKLRYGPDGAARERELLPWPGHAVHGPLLPHFSARRASPAWRTTSSRVDRGGDVLCIPLAVKRSTACGDIDEPAAARFTGGCPMGSRRRRHAERLRRSRHCAGSVHREPVRTDHQKRQSRDLPSARTEWRNV